MAPHFRDCLAWHNENLSMTTTSADAAKLFDSALTQYVTWTEDQALGGLLGTCEKMLSSDPAFIMGNAMALGLELMATGRTTRLDAGFSRRFDELRMHSDTRGNHREKLHCRAVSEWACGQYGRACDSWEEILLAYPNDMLALKFAHDGYFYLGESAMIRDSIGRVIPSWSRSSNFYGYLRGMQAFGFEETNMFPMAEQSAMEALSLNPTDCWATHAMAHCYEMTGRQSDGISFLTTTEPDWSKGAMLACHIYWHLSLYYIELGDHEQVLNLYDQQVGLRCKSGAMLDLVDAASLLQRLEFDGVDVGERWIDIMEIARPHIDDHIMSFNDLHFLMAFLGGEGAQRSLSQSFLASVQTFLHSTCENFSKDIFAGVGLPLMNALVAYKERRYDDAVEVLFPLKYKIVRIGGSNAQRDVFNQLLILSCIQSPVTKHRQMARALLQERKALKPSSPLTDRLHKRLMACHELAAD